MIIFNTKIYNIYFFTFFNTNIYKFLVLENEVPFLDPATWDLSIRFLYKPGLLLCSQIWSSPKVGLSKKSVKRGMGLLPHKSENVRNAWLAANPLIPTFSSKNKKVGSDVPDETSFSFRFYVHSLIYIFITKKAVYRSFYCTNPYSLVDTSSLPTVYIYILLLYYCLRLNKRFVLWYICLNWIQGWTDHLCLFI